MAQWLKAFAVVVEFVFSFQHPHGSSQPLITSVPEI